MLEIIYFCLASARLDLKSRLPCVGRQHEATDRAISDFNSVVRFDSFVSLDFRSSSDWSQPPQRIPG